VSCEFHFKFAYCVSLSNGEWSLPETGLPYPCAAAGFDVMAAFFPSLVYFCSKTFLQLCQVSARN
jgi:hypothetical protein